MTDTPITTPKRAIKAILAHDPRITTASAGSREWLHSRNRQSVEMSVSAHFDGPTSDERCVVSGSHSTYAKAVKECLQRFDQCMGEREKQEDVA